MLAVGSLERSSHDLAWMSELELLYSHNHPLVSVVIRDLNIRGITCTPFEAHTPLFVHANTVLTFPVDVSADRLPECSG